MTARISRQSCRVRRHKSGSYAIESSDTKSLRVLIDPLDHAVHHVNFMPALFDPMRLSRIDNQFRFDAVAFQPPIKLPTLSDGVDLVLFTDQDERRRAGIFDIGHR